MRRALVTGASGFVGGHVVHALHSRGITVRCLVRRSSRIDFIRPLAPELAIGDVTLPETLEAALEDVDGIVHCAGLTKTHSRAEYFRINEGGSRNLYATCRTRKDRIAKIVHLSSLAAFGPSNDGIPITEGSSPHPVSDYGESKLAGQRVAEACMAELPISIIVPPAVYGPHDVDFLVYFKFVARGIIPLIGKSARYLSLVYAKDLAEAIAETLVDDRTAGKSYLVDDGCIHTWTSLADTIGRAMNRAPKNIYMPAAALWGVAAIGDVQARLTGKARLINSQKVREFLQKAWTCSSQRIGDELGFHPQYPLERGIEETLGWYRENRWL
jgi:nucleoside-diphosphate-sugar epimerase